MAREILFRGICIKTKKWVYGGIVGLTENAIKHNHNFVRIYTGDIINGSKPENYMVNPDSVGQFTGLTDKNGVKIFEKDLCRYKNGKTIYSVLYSEKHGCYELYYNGVHGLFFVDIQDFNDIEVIGNVFEHPELVGRVK